MPRFANTTVAGAAARAARVSWGRATAPRRSVGTVGRRAEIALAAGEAAPQGRRAAFGRLRPGPALPGRIVAHMLEVAAREFGHPIAHFVAMEADDGTVHEGRRV